MSDNSSTDKQMQAMGFAGLAVMAAIGVAIIGHNMLGWPTWLPATVVVVVLIAAAVGAYVTRSWWSQSPADRKLRDASDLDDVMGAGAIDKGAELRGLSDDDPARSGLTAEDVAMAIGVVRRQGTTKGGQRVYKTLEDFTLIIMGPRSNKTSSQAVPRILAARGAVVATSNKPDLWILTAALRKEVGPIYAYDPGRIAFVDQMWWWNILSAVVDYKSAKRVATHFMAAVGTNNSDGGNSGFFDSSSKQMLSRTLLAAAVAGRSMRDVIEWIDGYSAEPVELLRDHGLHRHARALEAQWGLPQETLGGIQGGASAALESLQDESDLCWVTPPETWENPPAREIPELDLWTLFAPAEKDAPTLYLMTQEGAESSGPVVAAMVDQIFKLGDLAASASGGRISPEPVIVLDEAANICRIPDLPAKASHLGSKGILVDVILQSYQQGMGVWGREGMAAMWGASTCRIIGAGLQNVDDARMVSDLVGTHEVWKESLSIGPGGKTKNRSQVREPILPLEEVAGLSRNHALLIRQGSRPVLLDLLPWYREIDNAAAITEHAREYTATVRDTAIRELGDDNPLGARLRHRLSAV